MSTSRLWSLGAIALIAALLVGSWLLGISPKLTEASAANTDREAVEVQNAVHEATLTALEEQFADMDQLEEQLAALQVAVPNAAELPDLISQLNAKAIAHGVVITSITVTDPVAYVPAAEAPADPELAAAASSVTSDNFLGISVNMTVTGTYAQAMNFVADVQAGERIFLVHDLSLTEGIMSADSPVILNTTGQVFVLLEPDQIPAAPATETAAPAAAE
ncbi:type IV pilus inner membrane component PilO [Homoserinimonas sp. A447]